MPGRVSEFYPIKFFQPLIAVPSQVGNVATFWNKLRGKMRWEKKGLHHKAYYNVYQSLLDTSKKHGWSFSSTCYNQESGLFPCLYPSHLNLRDEDARLQTFGPNRPNHHPTLSPSEMSKAGFFWLGQGDRVKFYYCDDGLSRWKTDDDVLVEHAKWFPQCEYLLQQKGFAFVFQTTSRLTNFYRPLSRKLRQPVPAGLLLRKWVSFRENNQLQVGAMVCLVWIKIWMTPNDVVAWMTSSWLL